MPEQLITNNPHSPDTIQRAQNAQVELLPTDQDLTRACPVILSVVPPRDAAATAQRVVDAVVESQSSSSSSLSSSSSPTSGSRSPPLYFADLNAVAPSTIKSIAALFEKTPAVRFVDGSIIGGPPAPRAGKSEEGGGKEEEEEKEWTVPSIPTSGPHKLSDIPGYGGRLFEVLNMRHIGPEVGSASGLKSEFGVFSLLYCLSSSSHPLNLIYALLAPIPSTPYDMYDPAT